jgi:hypothetical protein
MSPSESQHLQIGGEAVIAGLWRLLESIKRHFEAAYVVRMGRIDKLDQVTVVDDL